MAATLINQPSMNPTRKLTAAIAATAVMELAKVLTMHFAPTWYSPELWAAMSPLVVLLVGYFVKDEANVVTLATDEYREVK